MLFIGLKCSDVKMKNINIYLIILKSIFDLYSTNIKTMFLVILLQLQWQIGTIV